MSLYTVDVNFDSDSCVGVKLSVTIDSVYNTSVPEWRLANRTLQKTQITSSSTKQSVVLNK